MSTTSRIVIVCYYCGVERIKIVDPEKLAGMSQAEEDLLKIETCEDCRVKLNKEGGTR